MRWLVVIGVLGCASSAAAHGRPTFPGFRPPAYDVELTLDIGGGASQYGVHTMWRLSFDATSEQVDSPVFLGIKRFWKYGWLSPHFGYGVVNGHTSWMMSVLGQVHSENYGLVVSAQEDLIFRGADMQGRVHAGYSHCLEEWHCGEKGRPRYWYAEFGVFTRHENRDILLGPYLTLQAAYMRMGIEYQHGFDPEKKAHRIFVLSAIDIDKVSWFWN